MLVWAKAHWQNVVRGFWFFPGLIALAFAVAAFVLVQVDRSAGAEGVSNGFGGDAEAARTVLATIAGSLITVAGLAFSITIVTLQLVSSQFTPRAVRSFLADRPSQLIAGAFVGIFAYCLLVLRVVRDGEDGADGFVPALSVSVAIAFGLVGLGLLLGFIHRITQIVKVESIAARIWSETRSALEALYPEPVGEPGDAEARDLLTAWEARGEPAIVRPGRPGYVRGIALADLGDAGLPGGARVHVAARPGDLVTRRTPIVRVWPAEALGEELSDRLCDLVSVQSERDVSQDVGFGLRQLADVALRALSPGVNDPTTALTCIGYLRDALERLAARRFPDEVRRLDDGVVAIVEAVPFAELLRDSLVEIGWFAAGDTLVACRLLDALAGIAAAAAEAGARDRLPVVLEVAAEVASPAADEARTERDRRLVAERLGRVRQAAGVT